MQAEDGKKVNREKKDKLKQTNNIEKLTMADEKLKKISEKKENIENNYLGEIKIAPEVLAMIVSRIVLSIQGVAGLVAHSKGGFGTLLGVKEVEERVKVDLVDEKHMSAIISVIVEYGSVIIDVAKKVQNVVKNEIEYKTGLFVKSIDINVIGIQTLRKNVKITRKENRE